jgi:hypothetical protein
MLYKKDHKILWRIEWAIKWFFPCMYFSEYEIDGHKEISVWRSWFGKTLWIRTWNIII